ncbi:hypothetical protein KDK77_02370 [bacterium]|nr:hypothetical protein [bacterium]
MILHALGTKVLVKMDARQPKTGRIFIPDSFVSREITGTVASIGEYVDCVDVNDRVLLRHNAGVELVIDDEEYTLVDEDSVLGLIEDSPIETI